MGAGVTPTRRDLLGLMGAVAATAGPGTSLAASVVARFPDASSTGVPPDSLLEPLNGNIKLSSENNVIEDRLITGNVVVQSPNCTLRRCKIVPGLSWHAIYNEIGDSGFLMEDCEIDGGGSTMNGVLGNGTFRRLNIHSVENGLNLWSDSLVEDSFIHDLYRRSISDQGDPHYDSIECNGGSRIRLIRNTLICDHDQTSALMLNNEFSELEDWVIDGNYMAGGGYTMYIDHRKSSKRVGRISVTNNRLGKGQWGYTAFYGFTPEVWEGNVDAVTGNPINL